MRRPFSMRLFLAGLLIVGLAGCHPFRSAPPRVLPESPTLEEVTGVVNANSAQIRTLYSTNASISSPGVPTLRGRIALERPRRLRLIAGLTALTGAEIDLGSNDEQFWFWARRNYPQALYYCRHDQFTGSQARAVLPVEPEWLIEALGIVEFRPEDSHRGPFPVGGERLEIQSFVDSPEGMLLKVTRIDAKSGWVLEQHLYDQRNVRIASALTKGHRRDELTGVTLPEEVEIQWPAATLTMTIRLGDPLINQLAGDPGELWSRPEIAGYASVDLADPRLQIQTPVSPISPTIPPPAYESRSMPEPDPEPVIAKKPRWVDRILRR